MSYISTGGGGRAYRLESLDFDFIKSPSTSWTSNSSSPSSTLSESSNSPLTIISTRKARTPRKRPNQTYNEAAAILSTAHPKIFPTKNLTKFSTNNSKFCFEPSDLIMPFQVIDTSEYLLHPPLLDRPHFVKGFNPFEKVCLSPGEINSGESVSAGIFGGKCEEDFDAESILDEEIGEGIDSIMGNSTSFVDNGVMNDGLNVSSSMQMSSTSGTCYGYPVEMGLGFDFGFGFGYGVRNEMRAMRNVVDEGDWWRFPSVNVVDVNPKIDKVSGEKKKKKKKVEMVKLLENSVSNTEQNKEADVAVIEVPTSEEIVPARATNAGLLLKLNYDTVLNEWSDKASPFSSGDGSGPDSACNDVQARLSQIDLFSENGGLREASVLRYKEKRRTRLFSKKIRYQVRKVNADQRPRMKGRFVRTPNSPED